MLYHHGKFNISVSNKIFGGWGEGARDGIQCQKRENISKYSLVYFFKKNFFDKLFLMKISTLLKLI